MDGRLARCALRGPAAAVLVPLVTMLAIAALVSALAAWLHAGRNAGLLWLRDVALTLDVLSALAVLGAPGTARRERSRRSGITEVDEMSGLLFEDRLAALYKDLGATVRLTGARGDFGADLLVERDGTRTVVQAKRYDGSVGIEAVQQVIGATRYYDAERAVVVTNSSCTRAATALAAANGVELVERDALVGLLAAHPVESARSAHVVVAAREIGGGAVLLVYAASRVLQLVSWSLRTSIRLSAVLWRAIR